MLRAVLVVTAVAWVGAFFHSHSGASRRGFFSGGDVRPRPQQEATTTRPFVGFTSTVLRMSSTVQPSDEVMETWLQDMIFSGDMNGYIQRQKLSVLTVDFIEYVEERLELSGDEDEKGALQEVLQAVQSKYKETEGLVDSGVVFEKRLDKILFCAPNRRTDLIKTEMADELTPAFIQYVQDELKNTQDTDGKVVLASILQLMGQSSTVGRDLLGGSAAILSLADASLGDQFKRNESELQFSMTGLGGVVENKDNMGIGDRNEQILASLLFSQNDILEDVLNNLHEIDDRFTAFLQEKCDKSKDIEERTGLQSLLETVTAVLERVREVQGDGAQGVVDEELTMDQVKQRMQEVQSGGAIASQSKAKGPEVFSVKKERRDTFQSVLQRFVGFDDAESMTAAVQANYELCDLEFQGMLQEEVQSCLAEGADAEAQQYVELGETIARVMAMRIGDAQEKLQRILAKRGVKAMESEIVAMCRRGEVDDALVGLMQANAQQAEAQGAKPAQLVLEQLLKRIFSERERALPDEQRLLRALLRETDSEKRKELLYSAFKQSKSMDSEGNMQDGAPLISPPAFINIARMFIQNFGNVDKSEMMGRVQSVIDEAQLVATELYGEGMSPRDQQRFMFEKQTVSVWDLANYEDQAVMSGEEVPWRNDKWDTKLPEDVLTDRVRKIGGADDKGMPSG